jgi:hypothetical protein
VDNCPTTYNNDQQNTDGDAAGDACDVCPNDPLDDADADTFCADVDNCPTTYNFDQTDGDSDDFGDACDNCPSTYNNDQQNTDGDAAGDACDTCPNDPLDDADSDGFCADADNCPSTYNFDQLDTDGDGPGDACDTCPNDPLDDADADGFCADVDNCPSTYNNDQLDTDGDGVGDACESEVYLTSPLDGATLDCRVLARNVLARPLITWGAGEYDRFRAMISWNPNFPTNQRVTSGETLLRKPRWRPSLRKWRRACDNAYPYLWIRVFAVDLDVRKSNPNRKTFSNVVQVDVLK